MAPRCAAIPGLMHARGDLARTRSELAKVAALAEESGGIVPRSEKDNHPDVMANLWFLRAAHDFGVASARRTNGQDDATFLMTTLMPTAKKILHQFISGAIDGVRMDDGGVLTGGAVSADDLRINALWYNALDMTAQLLKEPPAVPSARDLNASNHFDRLAGRFRRSFAKAFWCAEHNCICPPAVRSKPDHGKLPDPDQLLVTILPASPLPRTKQRQILNRIHDTVLGEMGVKIAHPELGVVESPVHRVWLARGFAADSAEGRAKAAALLSPLAPYWERAKKMLMHAHYKDGNIVPPGNHKIDPLTSAELLGALEAFDVRGR
jgi:hypothetical protein